MFNFSDFWHEVATAGRLKIDANDLFGTLFWSFWAKRDPKWRFSGIIKSQCIECVWFFAWIYSNITIYKWDKYFFAGIILSFSWSQMRFFRHFQKWTHGTVLIFCMRLRQHDLKLTQMIFWGKILHWSFWAKSGPKWVFWVL